VAAIERPDPAHRKDEDDPGGSALEEASALPGRPRQERAQVTLAAIILAAATVFAERGYARTTLDMVSVEAGVTKGALYFHFASKHDLANAVIAAELESLRAEAARVLELARPALETGILLSGIFTQKLTTDVVVRAGVKLTTEELYSHLDIGAAYEAWSALYDDLFARAIEEGDVAGAFEPAVLSRFLVGAFTGVQVVSNALDTDAEVFERVRQMWAIVLRAIVVPDRMSSYEDLSAAIRPA
jgi:AcrR family transcriptional regulator